MTSILQALDQKLSAQAQTGSVVLDAALFGEDLTLKDLLSTYFHDTSGQITIQNVKNYQYDQTDDYIVFDGVGKDGPFNAMTISQVLITESSSNTPQLAIDAMPGTNWTLRDTFPSLLAPVAGLLQYNAPEFFWASYTDDDANTVQGFYFQGELNLIPPFQFLLDFIGSLPHPILSGQIEIEKSTSTDSTITQYSPNASLAVDINEQPVTLGPLTLTDVQLTLNMSPEFNELDGRWRTETTLNISGTLEFKIGDTSTWFTVEVDINDPQTDVLFTASLDVDILGAITDLAALLGEESLSIPGFQLQHPDSIKLKSLQLSYNPTATTNKINFITVDMGTDDGEKWTLWDNFYLENIIVKFMIRPGQGVSGEIAGTIDNWLTIGADFASDGHYTFFGNEIQATPIKTVYTMFSGQSVSDLPDLDIDRLFVRIDIPPKPQPASFAGDIEITGDWTIVQTPVEVALRGLLFNIQRNVEGVSSGGDGVNNSVIAGGMLEVGNYVFSAKAAYTTAKGWDFRGAVDLEGTGHTITTFGQEIDNLFKTDVSAHLPSGLLDWYIPHIDTSFQSQTKDFTFDASLKNTAAPDLTLTFTFSILHSDSGYTRELGGEANYASDDISVDFKLVFSESTTGPSKTSKITATYQADKPPKLSDFLKALSKALNIDANLPESLALDAALNGLAAEIDKKDQDPMVAEAAGDFTLTIEGSNWELYFAYTNNTSFDNQPALINGARAYVFGVAVSGVIDLSKLPLVGTIPGINTLRIDKLGFYYTNAQFSDTNKTLIFDVPAQQSKNQLAPSGTSSTLMAGGFSLMAVFGNQQNQSSTPVNSMGGMQLPMNTGKPAMPGSPGFATQPSTPQSPIKWLDINKTFGPVGLQKIGFSYEKASDPATQLANIGFYLDGSFQIAGFSMALDRLGISFPIPKPSGGSTSFNPLTDLEFHLGGLFVDYQAPGFQIGGGFITLPGGSVNFIGEFIINVGEFGLQAYGGFSNELSSPSLFIFLHLEAPLGGPPFFFVKGLAGGFGVNRAFNLPTFDELTTYPLLPSNNTVPAPSDLTGNPQQQLDKMTQALTSLARYIPVKAGEYWLAAGVDVSSFEMINVSAVLSVAFGVDFQVGLVGNANMSFPLSKQDGAPPLAYISIDFEVSYSSSTGLFAAFGKLTPDSYVYAPFVHLMGGFAFLMWFSGEHEGDFLVTIGGYNPHFYKPAQYPSVPRLGVFFGIDSLNVSGDAYFALTPGMMMAGFGLVATWSMGPIEANFSAGMDFLINWKPFSYLADGYIHIAISLVIHVWFVKIRITVHVGVDLEIWGPKFGGRATVDLDIVSFTIYFGDAATPKAVQWADVQQMIPSTAGTKKAPSPRPRAVASEQSLVADPLTDLANLTVNVTQGLLKTYSDADRVDGLDWLLDPNGFELITQTAIPCTDAILSIAGPDKQPSTIDLKAGVKNQSIVYIDPDPARMQDSLGQEIEANKMYPFFAYQLPTSGNAWNNISYGVVPMNVTNVQTVHYVTVENTDTGTLINDLIYVLITKSVPSSLWSTSGTDQAKQGVGNSQQLIDNALIGFKLLPAIFFPARTSFIEYYYLVFEVNNLFLYASQAAVEAVPAVRAADYSDDDTTLIGQNMASGTLFQTAQTGSYTGTGAIRQQMATALIQLGFSTLALSNDDQLNTANYLDNPVLCYMSNTDEHQIGHT